MNKNEQLSALIGDKLLDYILYDEMAIRMPNLSVSNLITIRHRLASNEYLAKVWDVLYRNDFIDNYTIHQKGTMIEMQLTKAYKEGNTMFIQKCIKELLWYDIHVQFINSKKISTQNMDIMTDSINTRTIQTQTINYTKTKENQTSEIKTNNQLIQTTKSSFFNFF